MKLMMGKGYLYFVDWLLNIVAKRCCWSFKKCV